MIDMIKQNPVPAALIGIGLGWLYMNRGNSGADYAYRAERVGGPYGERRTVVRVDNASAGQGVTSKVGETASQAQDKAEDLASSASHMASEAASSAGHMASEAASAAGDVASTAGYRARDLSTTIMDTIKQNPVPAALAGISLAWLYKNSSSASTTGQMAYPTYEAGGTEYPYGAGQPAYAYGTRETSAPGGSQSPAGDITSKVGDTARQAQDKAKRLTSQAQDKAKALTNQARSGVGQAGGQARHQVQRAQGQVERLVQERPLVAGASALALGAALGCMTPTTRRESELLGGTRDRIRDKAEQVVSQAADKVGHVVDEVQTTAQKEAQREGLLQ